VAFLSFAPRTKALLYAVGLMSSAWSRANADDTLEDAPASPLLSTRDSRPRGAPPPLLPVGEQSASAQPMPASVAPIEARAPEGALRPRALAAAPRPVMRAAGEPVGHRFAPLERVEVAGTAYYPYSFDGHVHSEHSPDADHPVTEMLAAAERVGLDALVVTDHGSARSALSFARYKGALKPFVGQEIGGPYGHAVWWNVDAALPDHASKATLAERAAYAHERGGLIVLCHPGWWIEGREADPMAWITPDALRKGGVSGDIDALELWNGVYDKPLPRLITAWVDALEAGVFVPIVGGSDFHRFRAHRMGGPRNVALCDRAQPETCIWSAIRSGRSYVTDGPTLLLVANGKTFGESAQVAPGAALNVTLSTWSPRGGELRLYLGRQLVQSWPLGTGKTELQWSAPAPAAPTYLRAEVVRSVPGRQAPVFELLSNPVRVENPR
jgi:PHP domain